MADRSDRLHPIESRPDDPRSPFEHDRDRILYSSAFKRLDRVTQVAASTERRLVHNRLTHSLEVAQIGRGLATSILARSGARELALEAGGLNAEVVEAACLAHDLGHPPFGHVAETELDQLLVSAGVADGFEGNAQSFRIVSKLAVRYERVVGLNLTRATLRAILKYPWTRNGNPAYPTKWGAYDTEAVELAWALQPGGPGHSPRSLEAEMMDWADDVAYAVHDLEDFFRIGLIPLDRLATDEGERERFLNDEFGRTRTPESARDEIKAIFDRLLSVGPAFEPFAGTHLDRARLRSFTSSLIHDYIGAVGLVRSDSGAVDFQIDEIKKKEVDLLKGLTWYYVINSQALAAQRFGQRNLIASLFHILANAAATTGDLYVFPTFFQDQLRQTSSEPERLRTVSDYIASLTESQALELHQRLTGFDLGSGFDQI